MKSSFELLASLTWKSSSVSPLSSVLTASSSLRKAPLKARLGGLVDLVAAVGSAAAAAAAAAAAVVFGLAVVLAVGDLVGFLVGEFLDLVFQVEIGYNVSK